MKILAIDTSATVASVAVVDETHTIAEFTTDFLKNHSISLMPMVSFMLKTIETSLSDLDYIACAAGPGSFTGLRIGAATAKALAHGARKKIVPVPTLDALAYNVFSVDAIVVPMLDARRAQVYTAFYTYKKGVLIRLSEYMADDIHCVLEKLDTYQQPVIFTGDGSLAFRTEIQSKGLLAPSGLNRQRASAIGALAALRVETAVGYEEFVPFYLRKSQAEREYERNTSQCIK